MLGGKAPPTRAPETSCSHDAPCERPFRLDISRHGGRKGRACCILPSDVKTTRRETRSGLRLRCGNGDGRRLRGTKENADGDRLFGSVACCCWSSAPLTVQLYNGRWLFLIAKPEKTKKGTFFPEGTANTGKRAAWVMVACFAVTATLMAYEMSKMTGVPAFAQTSSILNNIALVAFCLSLLWTLFAGRDEQNYRDRFKKDGARLLVLLLGACAVMTALSILFV